MALAPFVRGLGGQVDTDELESVGQPLGIDQVVERRHDQTLRKVAGGTEDHHAARWRDHGAFGLSRSFNFGQLIQLT